MKGVFTELVHRKDVRDIRLGLQPEMNVVAENETVTDGHHTPGNTVVGGGNPLGSQEGRFDRPEDVFAGLIQLVQPTPQLAPLGGQAVSDDFVGSALELDFGGGTLFGLINFCLSHRPTSPDDLLAVSLGWQRVVADRSRGRFCRHPPRRRERSRGAA